MKSNNLTISIPTPRCKKNCSYCVSKMTGRIESNPKLFFNNVKKVQTLAEQAAVTNVLVTGKGEPLDNLQKLSDVAGFFMRYPLEVQVNIDRYINASNGELGVLKQYDVVALSADYIPNLYSKLTDNLHRITFVVTDEFNTRSFRDLIMFCKRSGIDQLSLRNPTVPMNTVNTEESRKAKEWINNNTKKGNYEALIEGFLKMKENTGWVTPLRKLNFGATVYDVDGISFTHFDYCVQDQNNGDDIRSLIYMEDGHLYTSWSFKSSKIF